MNELVVGALGALIGAPVCETTITHIPQDIAGWEYRNGRGLEAGFAPGSVNVSNATQERRLAHRGRDENSRRHCGVYALYDWCFGNDDQWLYQQDQDLRLYSHDHGHFFPGGPNWTEATLLAALDTPHILGDPINGLDQVELQRLVSALEQVNRGELIDILSKTPGAWPVSNKELEALGYFLEYRIPSVIERIRDHIRRNP